MCLQYTCRIFIEKLKIGIKELLSNKMKKRKKGLIKWNAHVAFIKHHKIEFSTYKWLQESYKTWITSVLLN